MAITSHQVTFNLPYSPIRCLLFLITVIFALVLFFQTFISMFLNSGSKELNGRFLDYHFQPKNQEQHQCDGRYFKCASNFHSNAPKIIPYSRRCDGMSDCPLGDDEENCKKCLTSFSCPSHDNSSLICLRANRLCDDNSDCPRGEDELLPQCQGESLDYMEMAERYSKSYSEEENECEENEFNCYGIKCISKEKVCDGEIDCVFSSTALDERNCKPYQCQGGARYCAKPAYRPPPSNPTVYDHMRGHMKCLPPWALCDGTVDCLDYSDEHFQQCDNMENCPGACFLNHTTFDEFSFMKSDMEEFEAGRLNLFVERPLYGHSPKKELFENNALCSDGQWINKIAACSGHYPNCEKNCQECTLGAFKCKKEGRCLTPDLICDGVKDCKDGSDEKKCKGGTKNCNNSSKRCNGVVDCKDGRDERNCTNCEASSRMPNLSSYGPAKPQTYIDYRKGFHCANDSQCVSHLKRCDGVQDCPNGEDEENCSCYECLMHSERMYICKQGRRCFKWEEVCDGEETKCPNPAELDKEYCSNRTLSVVQN